MHRPLALCAALLFASVSSAADIAAGKARASTVCAACHGANGVSVADAIPNLAGQRAAYLESQLAALKAGTRKNPIMNAIAAQLAPADIADVAAYFASLPGPSGAARSALLPSMARAAIAFPDGYEATFALYDTLEDAAAKQVTRFYANRTAIDAARAGKPLPDGSVILGEIHAAKVDAAGAAARGPDGKLMPDRLVAYSAMEREAGWGNDLPEMLRNGDWRYAVFTPAREPRAGVNQALCLACHKPQAEAGYVFTAKELAAAARGAGAR